MPRRPPSPLAEALAWAPQAALLGIARALPYRARLAFGGGLVRLALFLLPHLRRRAEINLALIFPDKPASERHRITRSMADHLGRTLVEILTNDAFRARAAWTPPSGAGWPGLEARLAAGQGALLVSGHFGQWEAARAALKARGTEVAALYRPVRNRHLQAHYRRNLEAGGRPLFTRDRAGLRDLVRHLRSGGVVAVLMDQYVNRGIMLDFLGQPAPTGTMIAELSVKYGVPMFPIYATRAPDRLHVAIEVEAPIPPGNPETMTQSANNSLAARIRADPEQYLWLHRRWSKNLDRGNAGVT